MYSNNYLGQSNQNFKSFREINHASNSESVGKKCGEIPRKIHLIRSDSRGL